MDYDAGVEELSEKDQKGEATAVARICRRAPRQFYWPTFFLPPRQKHAAQSLLAFFVIASEAINADTSSPASPSSCGCGSNTTQLLRDRIDVVYSNNFALPLPEFRDENQHVLSALAQTVNAFEIPQLHFHTWLDGLCAERATRRYATWSSLARHCDATAGSLAQTASCVLGVTRSDARQQMLAFGRGLKLSQILRELAVSRALNKIDLPLEDLIRFRVLEKDVLQGTWSSNFDSLLQHEIERAADELDNAQQLIPWLAGDGSRIAASMVLAHARADLQTLSRSSSTLLKAPVARTFPFSLRTVATVWRLSRVTPCAPTTSPSSPSSDTL